MIRCICLPPLRYYRLKKINLCVRLLTTFPDENLTSNPAFIKYIERLKQEYSNLMSENTQAESRSIKSRMSDLEPVVRILQERKKLEENLAELNELDAGADKDEELHLLSKEERQTCNEKIKVLDSQLLDILVPEDPQDNCESIMLEVSAGVGGQEAMLFAAELFQMYNNFADFKGWDSQPIEFDETETGGIRHGTLLVNGKCVYQFLKHEIGVHRVQRIPVTEKSGRIHTSTVSVAVLPQPDDCEVVLHDKDLVIETKRSSGAGGQHVNKTESAVRITHLPTNISVECQVDRSQIRNRQLAMQKLKTKLYNMQMEKQLSETVSSRKEQIGSKMRSEKIRTYNFSQDRITDHRYKNTLHNLKGFLTGQEDLEHLILNLQSQDYKDRLLKFLASCK